MEPEKQSEGTVRAAPSAVSGPANILTKITGAVQYSKSSRRFVVLYRDLGYEFWYGSHCRQVLRHCTQVLLLSWLQVTVCCLCLWNFLKQCVM
jgi:hypothetical protein